jgi:hypothetical protein
VWRERIACREFDEKIEGLPPPHGGVLRLSFFGGTVGIGRARDRIAGMPSRLTWACRPGVSLGRLPQRLSFEGMPHNTAAPRYFLSPAPPS